MDKRIGAQYWTLRDYCQTLEDFDATCKKVREMGYKTVQLSGIGDFTAEEIKEVLDKHDLIPVCTHRSFKSYLENLDEVIKFHKTIGCKVCGIGELPDYDVNDAVLTIERLEEFGRDFTPVCEKLKESGLVFGYHNHAYEFAKIDGKRIFDIIFESVKSDNFKLILDVYWLAYAGINPAKFIRENKGKIACVHFKDLIIDVREQKYAEIGEGNLDWDDIIAACEEADIEWALVEQDECDGNPFDSLKISYDFLSGKGFN